MNPISGRRVHESESFHDFSQTLVYPEPVYEKSDHLYLSTIYSTAVHKIRPLRAATRSTPERGGAGDRNVVETRAVHEYQ